MKEQSYEESREPSPWYKMKSRPKHLPHDKQDDLHITETIRPHHQAEMIILFGSHARGDAGVPARETNQLTR